MTQPRFSVVTTCLNQQNTIERTICSVIDQTCDDFELIVVDRGSTDNSLQLVDLYEDDLTLINAPTSSKAQALNLGVARATGEFIAFVDDMLLPESLSIVSEHLTQAPKTQWLVGDIWQLDENDLESGLTTACAPENLCAFLMHDAGLLPLASTFIKRDILNDFGTLDTNYKHAFDFELASRLLTSGMTPTVIHKPLTTCWQKTAGLAADQTLHQGLEQISIARRYGHKLPIKQRYEVWKNCEQRQRIYALAETELHPDLARKQLWQKLLRHPWWIMNETVRDRLVHGVSHPAPSELDRIAA